MQTYIAGHLNNDTDSVVSAIALSYLEKKLGENYEPSIVSPINKETAYVLERFGFSVPANIPGGDKKVVLVDHNEPSQISPSIKNEEIIRIIDHHKLGGLATALPLSVKAEPVGSTATIVADIFKEKNISPTKEIAGILCAGIISDTLNLASPTTTEDDKKALDDLAKTAGIDAGELAGEMFQAKSDIRGIETSELIEKDYKVFSMGDKSVGIGVWETMDTGTVLERKDEIMSSLENKKDKDRLDLVFFAVVDIIKNESVMFAIGKDEADIIEKSFDITAQDHLAALPGVVSRKKQIAPAVEKALLLSLPLPG